MHLFPNVEDAALHMLLMNVFVYRIKDYVLIEYLIENLISEHDHVWLLILNDPNDVPHDLDC